MAEVVFQVRLPFWTEIWGWSLVATNLFALPLMNMIGLFMEETEEKDYLGLLSFVVLTYIVAPFQAYAAIKGFIEKKEGPWFRTPKTGRITDRLNRGKIARFVQGIFGRPSVADAMAGMPAELKMDNRKWQIENTAPARASAFSNFDAFKIVRKRSRWVGKSFLAILLVITTTLISYAPYAPYFVKQADAEGSAFGMIDTTKDQAANKIQGNKDFSWGVLAINSNKSIYSPGEKAKLEIGVLDETGAMVCDAQLMLKIRNPIHSTSSGQESEIRNLTTQEGTIRVNHECYVHDYVTKPDYEASYIIPNETGKYTLTLTAKDKNGSKTITDSFEVVKDIPYDIERITNTRIYPVKNYPVTLKIKANRDFQGTIKDTVPSNFGISKPKDAKAYDSISITAQGKVVNWKVSLKKGEQIELGYIYKAPPVSPEYYTLSNRMTNNGAT